MSDNQVKEAIRKIPRSIRRHAKKLLKDELPCAKHYPQDKSITVDHAFALGKIELKLKADRESWERLWNEFGEESVPFSRILPFLAKGKWTPEKTRRELRAYAEECPDSFTDDLYLCCQAAILEHPKCTPKPRGVSYGTKRTMNELRKVSAWLFVCLQANRGSLGDLPGCFRLSKPESDIKYSDIGDMVWAIVKGHFGLSSRSDRFVRTFIYENPAVKRIRNRKPPFACRPAVKFPQK